MLMRVLQTLPQLLGIVSFPVVLAGGCGGDDDDNGATEADKCAQLKDVAISCYDSGCRTATSSFCTCWKQGQDISIATCQCIPASFDALCQLVDVNTFDPAQYDCGAAMSTTANICSGT